MLKRITAIVIVLLITLGGVGNVAADSTALAPVSSGGGTSNSSNTAIGSDNIMADKNLKVSKEEAKKISLELIKKYFELEIDEKKYQGTVQLTPNYEVNNSSSWHFSWNMSSNTMFAHINMKIDASTGKLIGFNRSESYRSQEQVVIADITKEQARKLAEEFLKKTNPEE
ncbi:MAG: YcdB/YcdC domain-containing protein [Clostridia bacterium]